MVKALAIWWLRRHRPDDIPERASLMWVWSKDEFMEWVVERVEQEVVVLRRPGR